MLSTKAIVVVLAATAYLSASLTVDQEKTQKMRAHDAHNFDAALADKLYL